MDKEKDDILFLGTRTEKFLRDFALALADPKQIGKGNDKMIGSAFIYEKIRVALEYQEDHLVFKNAISRIIRRKYTLSIVKDSKQLVADLISELSWANYLNPEALDSKTISKIEKIVDRYLTLLNTIQSGRFPRHEWQKMVVDWLACEIEEIFYPALENQIILDYTYEVISPSLDLTGSRLNPEESKIQLLVAIYTQLFKPDLPKIQYFVIKQIYPDWQTNDPEATKKIARSFDPYFNKIDRAINHPYRKKYYGFVKKNIAPFILLRKVLASSKLDLDKIKERPRILVNLIIEAYNDSVMESRRKVWRGTFRALIFILLTKISLAFIIEVPFDRYFSGAVDYMSLIINVSLPPLLMFAAGTFVKSPPAKNLLLITKATKEIMTATKIEGAPFKLVETKAPRTFYFFNIFYSIFTLAVLFGVIRLLIYLKFNFVSIGLFFFFVSIVSFFSFRIRNIALELAMKRSRDDALTSTLELLFLPFINLGKQISDRFNRFNPVILMLDFLIEAPLKIIIQLMNSWLRFVNIKKEELEY